MKDSEPYGFFVYMMKRLCSKLVVPKLHCIIIHRSLCVGWHCVKTTHIFIVILIVSATIIVSYRISNNNAYILNKEQILQQKLVISENLCMAFKGTCTIDNIGVSVISMHVPSNNTHA